MANYTQYIPQVNSTTYPVSISNCFTALTADVTAAESAITALQTDKLDLAGGAMTGTITNFTSTGIDDNATTVALTIDANDNIGIGNTTLEAWDASQSVVQLGGLGALWAGSSQVAGQGNASSYNMYYDGVFKYIITDEASYYNQNNGTHVFAVAAAGTADTAITWKTALNIDNNANVGIGVTPSAWDPGIDVLQIGPKMHIGVAANTTYFTRNAYYDGVNWVYQLTDEVQLHTLDSSGQFSWDVAASGTAGNPITWTRALTIGNNGDTTFGGNVAFADSLVANFGSSNDLRLRHNGTNSLVENFTGNLYLDCTTTGSTIFRTGSYANALILNASQNATFGGNISVADGKFGYYGTDNDLRITHSGAQANINNYTGNFAIEQQVNSGLLYLSSLNSLGTYKTGIIVGGAIPEVKLHYDGTAQITTASGGPVLNATPTAGDNSLKIATTAYVDTAAAAVTSSGTWTPSIQDLLFSDSEGQTYSSRRGSYVKIGTTVFISGYISLSSLGTLNSAWQAYIGGLPFNAVSTNDLSGVSFTYGGSMSLTAGTSVSGFTLENSPRIKLQMWNATGGSSNLLIGNLTGSTTVKFIGQYKTSS